MLPADDRELFRHPRPKTRKALEDLVSYERW